MSKHAVHISYHCASALLTALFCGRYFKIDYRQRFASPATMVTSSPFPRLSQPVWAPSCQMKLLHPYLLLEFPKVFIALFPFLRYSLLTPLYILYCLLIALPFYFFSRMHCFLFNGCIPFFSNAPFPIFCTPG